MKVQLVGHISKFFINFIVNVIYFLRNCLPYFKKAQNHELALGSDDPFRGNTGPLYVMQGKCENLLHQAFIKAGTNLIGFTQDMNGFRQEGVGKMDMTIKNGVRWSTSKAYLSNEVNTIFF